MQFAILDFGLDHFTSQPFIFKLMSMDNVLTNIIDTKGTFVVHTIF